MKKRHVLWTAFAATLALTACGGGSDDSPTPTPSPSPTPAGDRIEPFDTAKSASAAPAKATPAALSKLPAGAVPAQVALGPLADAKSTVAQGKNGALQIGLGREVVATARPGDLAQQLRWSTLADGSSVAAVSFEAEGAKAIRLAVLAQALPAGAVLRFYGAKGSEVIEMTSTEIDGLQQTNLTAGVAGDAALTVWGPDTNGALSTLEIQLPAGVAAGQLRLAVPQLSHLFLTLKDAMEPQKDTAHIGRSGSCNLDVVCTSELQAESRSVAKMSYSDSTGSYLCTGTLLNDTRNSQTPYFLTANHCISTQAAASTLITYWFFRSASCNSSPSVDPAFTRVTGGANLLFTNTSIDTTLLQLRTQPPARVVYAGSYFGSGVGPDVGVIGIHHPSGDLQKASAGLVDGYGNCNSDGCASADVGSGGLFRVRWNQGTTEGGSSGSAIFARSGATRYVVGALHGGSASCTNPTGSDYYGRFDRAFSMGVGNWLQR